MERENMKYKNNDALPTKERLDGDTVGIWDGIAYIIWNNKGKTIYITAMGDESDKLFTLNDCLKAIGYDGDGSVLVILEDALHGTVYRYGNYLDKAWCEVGTTIGYA